MNKDKKTYVSKMRQKTTLAHAVSHQELVAQQVEKLLAEGTDAGILWYYMMEKMDSKEKTSNFERTFTTHHKSKLEHLFALQVNIKDYLPLSTCLSGHCHKGRKSIQVSSLQANWLQVHFVPFIAWPTAYL